MKVTYRYEFWQKRWCSTTALLSANIGQNRYPPAYDLTGNYRNGIEVGLTIGMLWNIFLYQDYLAFYLGGFIGPQYTPNMPLRQEGWLNFSDNLCSGFNVKISKHLYSDVRFIFRHLSNAGLFKTNHGINSLGFGTGLFYRF